MTSGIPLSEWLTRRARDAPRAPALVRVDRIGRPRAALDQRQLAERADGLIAAARVPRGGRVAVLSADPLLTAVALHAALRADWTLIPLDPGLPRRALRATLARVRPTRTLTSPRHARRVGPGATVVRRDGRLRIDGPPGPLDRVEARLMVLTSGTSGRPKGVLLTDEALAGSARAVSGWVELAPAARWLAPLPLWHVGGLAILLRCLCAGAVALLRTAGDRSELAATLARTRPEWVSLVPTQLRSLLDDGAPPPAHGALLGGGPAGPALVLRGLDAGWPLRPSYGLSEAGSTVTGATPAAARAHPASVGRPLPGVALRLTDAAADGAGEVCVRGPGLTTGYDRQPAATRRLLRGRWLHTGDLGRLDDGRLTLVGRRSDRIVTGGENVDPAEVEATLRRDARVRDACVVGIPDPVWGERVAAALVLEGQTDPRAVIQRAARQLARHQRPTRWRTLDALPRTALDKPSRARLVALFADLER